jgi:hypothetical protein
VGILAAVLLTPGARAQDGAAAPAQPPRYGVEVEGGALWQGRNVARIPGDGGTYFSVRRLTGSGPDGFYRLTATARVRHGQEVRAVWAPLRAEGTGTLDAPVRFAGRDFGAGVPTRARYRFDAPRATYRWRVRGTDGADRFYVGFTALVRDAEIRLTQGGTTARDANVGFVPLLHLAGDWGLAPGWRLAFDFDGLAAPQGRAFDAGVRVTRDIAPGWYAGAGYRVLEGGADNDRVFNFAWVNYASVALGRRF